MGSSLIVRAEGGNREFPASGKGNRRNFCAPHFHAVRTLEEVSEVFGVTRERVRQIERNALGKLRRGILADPLLRQIAVDMNLTEEDSEPLASSVASPKSQSGAALAAEIQRRADKMGVTITRDKPKAVRQPKPQPPVARVAKPAPVVATATMQEQEAWLRDVLTKARVCVGHIVEVVYFQGRSRQEASRLLGIPTHQVERRLSSALRFVRGKDGWGTRYRGIYAALESLLSDPPNKSSRPSRIADPVVQALVEQKVGTTTGVGVPQPTMVVSCQLSVNESSKVTQIVAEAIPADPPSWAAMESTAKGQTWADTLTKPERDVLNLLLTGAENKGIAARLDCALRTVETRRAVILKKAGVTNSVALAVASVKAGLVA